MRSYTIIEKLRAEKDRRLAAAGIITNLSCLGFWKGVLLKTLSPQQINYHLNKIREDLKHLRSFSASRRVFSSSKTLEEEISRNFMFLREDHKNLERRINVLCEKNLILLEKMGLLEVTPPPSEPDIDNLRRQDSKILYTPWLKRMKYKQGLNKIEEGKDIIGNVITTMATEQAELINILKKTNV